MRLRQAAVSAGELVPSVEVPRLARTLEAMLGGSLFTWAIYLEGIAAQWIRDDLDAALAPYLSVRRPRRRTPRRVRKLQAVRNPSP